MLIRSWCHCFHLQCVYVCVFLCMAVKVSIWRPEVNFRCQFSGASHTVTGCLTSLEHTMLASKPQICLSLSTMLALWDAKIGFFNSMSSEEWTQDLMFVWQAFYWLNYSLALPSGIKNKQKQRFTCFRFMCMSVWVFLPACVCLHPICDTSEGRRGFYSLKLELWVVVSQDVGVENQTWVLSKSIKCL